MTDKLQTIDELMKGQVPGSVKVYPVDREWDKPNYFQPYFKDDLADEWFGKDKDGGIRGFHINDYGKNVWALWTPPKVKKKYWQNLFINVNDQKTYQANGTYESFEKAKANGESNKNEYWTYLATAPIEFEVPPND